MVNYREILRLRSLGYSQRQIAASVHSSRDTVGAVFKLADEHEIEWPLEEVLTDTALQRLFYPKRLSQSDRKEPNYGYIHKELAKSGVNLSLLWSEYCESCYAEKSIPYMYTQFCEKYRDWASLTKATMRIRHKPGDTMQVDWAGNTMDIYDPFTGETFKAYLFVSVLPCSCYAYAEACTDMRSESWILCHVHAYNYFGGVTRILIPDNLKTGIVKNTRYETVLNRSYSEMAEHYDTAIIPARVEHPKDKSMAEGTVKHASTWIIAALRNRKFFSLQELQDAVAEKLEEFNSKPFQRREGSRLTAFINEEKPFLKQLPISSFEPAVWSTATVQSDYLITDGKNKFSVPFDLIGETVDTRVTRNTIEAFYRGARVASHPRLEKIQRYPIVLQEHMPEEHKKYLTYNESDFLAWANSIGNGTLAVVKEFLNNGKVSEQGYKSCASLTKLSDRYGHERLENACTRALAYTSQPTVRSISTILKNGQDKVKSEQANQKTTSGSRYGITRGSEYFSKGGAKND
jgi:transposase